MFLKLHIFAAVQDLIISFYSQKVSLFKCPPPPFGQCSLTSFALATALVPVIERLLAPRLITELVICRFIHGKTHKAYFPWDQILYLPCSLTVQIILKKIFVGYVKQR